VLSLLSESRPEENELKSEAQFQRLLASYTGNPLTPKTPRAPSDRGRYPEEAGDEDEVAVQSEDDDDELGEGSVFDYTATTEAISISRRGTPAQSLNGDDPYSWNPGSPVGSSYMDVDPVSVLFSLSICAYIDAFIPSGFLLWFPFKHDAEFWTQLVEIHSSINFECRPVEQTQTCVYHSPSA